MIKIFKFKNEYLSFNKLDVIELRKKYNIIGSLISSLPSFKKFKFNTLPIIYSKYSILHLLNCNFLILKLIFFSKCH